MTNLAKANDQKLWNWLRLIGWSGAVILLMLPLVAMQLGSPGVDWSLSDFLVMGAMLGTAGLVLELATRRSSSFAYRIATVFAVGGAFLLVWVNLAVGFLGNEDNPANAVFLGVIGVALVGSFLARSDARRMERAMVATAVAQLLAGVWGFLAGWSSPGPQGLYEVAMGTTLFGGIWLVSAMLYGKAARDSA